MSEKELMKIGSAGLDFGDHTRSEKAKQPDFEYQGDLYYVKSWKESTRLEKNGRFLYESVPGTTVQDFAETEEGVSFLVSGVEEAQITLELAENTAYRLVVDEVNAGDMVSGGSGKLTLSVEFNGKPVAVSVRK